MLLPCGDIKYQSMNIQWRQLAQVEKRSDIPTEQPCTCNVKNYACALF